MSDNKRREVLSLKRVGILTSGGDCQSLNATMRGVAKALYQMYDDVEIIEMCIRDRYVAAGLLSSFAPAWFYLLTGVRGKKRQFLVSIEDYFENTVVARLQTGDQENAVLETEEEKTDPAAEERKKEKSTA